jgi:hypothetical protein
VAVGAGQEHLMLLTSLLVQVAFLTQAHQLQVVLTLEQLVMGLVGALLAQVQEI